MDVKTSVTRNALNELEARFSKGEKLTVETMVKDLFSPKDPFEYLMAKEKIRGYIGSLKKKFRKEQGIWFGVLNPLGEYGLPTTEVEYTHCLKRYYFFITGNLKRASELKDEATTKGLLSSGFKFSAFILPEPNLEKEKEVK